MKKVAKNLPVATSTKRGAKKGSSTPRAKKKRSTARYVDVKIRIPIEDVTRGIPYFGEEKLLGRFIVDAYREKINRSEANDKAARTRILLGNIEILTPLIHEMYKQGKLNFLKDPIKEIPNG